MALWCFPVNFRKFHKFHRKTPVALWCFPVNFLKFLGMSFLKESYSCRYWFLNDFRNEIIFELVILTTNNCRFLNRVNLAMSYERF